MPKKITREFLDGLYRKYNRREYVHPDPLEFLYNYAELKDREVVGLVASSLAYGRVAQILKSVTIVLKKMGRSPYAYLMKRPPREIEGDFRNFKHRFTTGGDKSSLLIGLKRIIEEYGSVYSCFTAGFSPKDETLMPALSKFVAAVAKGADVKALNVLPPPEKGSACKRLNLYLRWMIRSDEVDPGGWAEIPKEKLIVPLDTHMFKIGKNFGWTKRAQANLKTAVELTNGFKRLNPADPVKYDFTLTRFGIRNDLTCPSQLC